MRKTRVKEVTRGIWNGSKRRRAKKDYVNPESPRNVEMERRINREQGRKERRERAKII